MSELNLKEDKKEFVDKITTKILENFDVPDVVIFESGDIIINGIKIDPICDDVILDVLEFSKFTGGIEDIDSIIIGLPEHFYESAMKSLGRVLRILNKINTIKYENKDDIRVYVMIEDERGEPIGTAKFDF